MVGVMYCKKCGEKLQENMNFCNQCGETVIKGTENINNINLSNEEQQVNNKTNYSLKIKKRNRIIISSVIAFGFVAIIFILILINNSMIRSEARDAVIEKFSNERNVVGTSKFIEDKYQMFSDDEVISAIYFLNRAYFSYELLKDNEDSASDEAINNVSSEIISNLIKIPNDYKEEFSDEIIQLKKEMMNYVSQEQVKKIQTEDNIYASLSERDKKMIVEEIENLYKKYDDIDGEYTEDKYTNEIWKRISEKYNIGKRHVDEIWREQ